MSQSATEPAPPRLTRPSDPAQEPPLLPERFGATLLCTPYVNDEVVAVRLQYDASSAGRPMMVMDLAGAQQGRLTLLCQGDQLWFIVQGGARIGPFTSAVPVPGRDWLRTLGLKVQGSGALMGRDCDWFLGYSPNNNGYVNDPPPPTPAELCDWFWIDRATGYPFRIVNTSQGSPSSLPYLGIFCSTLNFVSMTESLDPELEELAAASDAAEAPGDALRQAVEGAKGFEATLAAIREHAPHLEGEGGVAGSWVEGLGPPPANAVAPFWSPRMWLTGYTFQTAKPAPGGGDAAMPLRVFYEANAGGDHMLTRCAMSQYGFEDVPVMDIILGPGGNDTVIRDPNGTSTFEGHGATGIVRPDWASLDDPHFKAQIVDNPVLCPGRTLVVTTLPSDHGRWFWIWYTPDGSHGQLFMETPQCGDVGLVLTDYFSYDTDPPPFPPGWHDVPKHKG